MRLLVEHSYARTQVTFTGPRRVAPRANTAGSAEREPGSNQRHPCDLRRAIGAGIGLFTGLIGAANARLVIMAVLLVSREEVSRSSPGCTQSPAFAVYFLLGIGLAHAFRGRAATSRIAAIPADR